MADIAEEYLTTRQAADRVGLHQSHIRLLIRKGSLKAQRIGFVWLVSIASLDQYMANRPRPGLKRGQKITRPRKVAKS